MPVRPFSRDLIWLLPPSLDELVPQDHAARFVAAFVDGLSRAEWLQMGIDVDGEALGAPGYSARALLCVWVYGFLGGVRSARKLEASCKEQLPYRWLTGNQFPDHNTLWRFYKDNRESMRKLLKRTVRTAVCVGLVDLAVQALDGSKIAGNASSDRTYDREGLEKLIKRTEEAIAELEGQNSGGEGPSLPHLPAKLAQEKVLREKVQAALEQVKALEQAKAEEEVKKSFRGRTAEERAKAKKAAKVEGKAEAKKQAAKNKAKKERVRINLTDEDTRLVKSRQGIVAGYNAQAVVSPLKQGVAKRNGMLITAAEVVNDPDDHGQLVPMIELAKETTERDADKTLADGGFHSGANLAECEVRGYRVLMPESSVRAIESPYHKDHFEYDAEADTYTCPHGEKLEFRSVKKRTDRPEARVYRAPVEKCRVCPAFGECTKDAHQGRTVEVGPYEEELRRHREAMATEQAKEDYRQRKELIEPTFGIIKEQQGVRRFLLRGTENVRAEWTLLATAFNLRTLWRVWQQWTPETRLALTQ